MTFLAREGVRSRDHKEWVSLEEDLNDHMVFEVLERNLLFVRGVSCRHRNTWLNHLF
jgi:hypothetical protein